MSTEHGWGAVILGGSKTGLQRTARRLERLGYRLFQTSRFRAIVDDVRSSALEELTQIAQDCGCAIEALHDEKQIPLPRSARPKQRRALRLALESDKWYFAENAEEIFPLVLIRESRIEKIADDHGEKEVQTFLLELLGPEDGLPYKIEADSRVVSRLGLRPATQADFEKFDLVPPTIGDLAIAPDDRPRYAAPRTAAAKNFARTKGIR